MSSMKWTVCHIKSPLYVADASESCSYALFINDKAKINSVCILSVINQTQHEAIGQDSSVGRAVDLHARGPGFNTWPGLTQPSIPLWLGKMTTQQT